MLSIESSPAFPIMTSCIGTSPEMNGRFPSAVPRLPFSFPKPPKMPPAIPELSDQVLKIAACRGKTQFLYFRQMQVCLLHQGSPLSPHHRKETSTRLPWQPESGGLFLTIGLLPFP